MKQLLAAVVVSLATASLAATPEKVIFDNQEDGSATRLTGYLYRPTTADAARPATAIVLAHGCSGMLDDKGNIRAGIKFWAERFVEKGWVVLAVDSFNPRGHKQICTLKDRPILESRERPRDDYAALKYLAGLPYVQKNRVFLMGFSHGATGTLYASDRASPILKRAQESKLTFRAALAFYPGCTSMDKRSMVPGIPLGIFMGAADDWTPAAPCTALAERAAAAGADTSIRLYADAYHGFDVPGAKVHIRNDVRMSNRPELSRGVHVGGNDRAREAAVKDVDEFLARHLK